MRVLVSAASRHGSTAEVATELGKALCGALPGAGVDVIPLSRVTDVSGYDAADLRGALSEAR